MVKNIEQGANERLIKIFNFLLTAGIIVLISVFFVSKFIMPQTLRTTSTAMDTISRNFSSRMFALHNLWTIEHNSNFVLPTWANIFNEQNTEELGFDPKKLVFKMTSSGWVRDVSGVEGKNSCERIWMVVLGKKLKLYYTDVKTVDLPNETLCVYYADQIGFSYNYSNGDIQKVNKVDHK